MDDAVAPSDEPAGPTRRFEESLQQGRLAYQRCTSCSSAVFPPRVLCHVCGSDALVWQVSDGAGTVYSASTLSPRDADSYTVVLVDLDEGFRVMSVVAGAEAPLGHRVQVAAQPSDDAGSEPRLVSVLHGGKR